jgi:hypothetical protein
MYDARELQKKTPVRVYGKPPWIDERGVATPMLAKA